MDWETTQEHPGRALLLVLGMVALGYGFVLLGPALGWAELHVTALGKSPVHWIGQALWAGAFGVGLYLMFVWPVQAWLLPQYSWNGPTRVGVTAFLWTVPLLSFVYFLTSGGVFDLGELIWIVLPWTVVGAIVLEGTESPAIATVALAGGIVASVKGVHDAVGPFGVLFNYMALSPRFYVLREGFSLLALAAAALVCLRHWTGRERRWAISGALVGVGVYGALVYFPVFVGMAGVLLFLWLPFHGSRYGVALIAGLGLVSLFWRPAPVPSITSVAILLYALAAGGALFQRFGQAGDSSQPVRDGRRGSLRDE